MRLGELIATLERMPQSARIRFDSGYVPGKLCSWRGSYDELTLPSGGAAEKTVADVLRDARAADGGTFEGYKGGDFTMNWHTPVWADAWGECDYRMLVGCVLDEGVVVLKTTRPSEYA